MSFTFDRISHFNSQFIFIGGSYSVSDVFRFDYNFILKLCVYIVISLL